MRRFAAIQMRFNVSEYMTLEKFQSKLDNLMGQVGEASGATPSLVVFPEDVGTGLLFCDQRLRKGRESLAEALRSLIFRNPLPVGWRMLRHRIDAARAFGLWRARVVRLYYEKSFSLMARKYRSYVVAGSILLPEFDSRGYPRGSAIHNISYVYDPNGRLIGMQKKTHLIDLEGPEGFNLTPGEIGDLNIMETDVGRLAVAVCLDAFKEPVIERFASLGADILIQPSANPGPWTPEQQLDWKTGSWHFVWERSLFEAAINPMGVGSLFDIRFDGQSSIISRGQREALVGYQDVGPEPGFVAVGKAGGQEDVIVAVEKGGVFSRG